MFLLDTNIWLELFLNQENAKMVSDFLQNTEASLISMTDFTLFSIGIILTRFKKDTVLEDFLSETIEDSGVWIIHYPLFFYFQR